MCRLNLIAVFEHSPCLVLWSCQTAQDRNTCHVGAFYVKTFLNYSTHCFTDRFVLDISISSLRELICPTLKGGYFPNSVSLIRGLNGNGKQSIFGKKNYCVWEPVHACLYIRLYVRARVQLGCGVRFPMCACVSGSIYLDRVHIGTLATHMKASRCCCHISSNSNSSSRRTFIFKCSHRSFVVYT